MLICTYEVQTALRYAAEHNSGLEVGGFGRTHIADNGEDIVVSEIYIPPQVVQAGHTDIKGPGEVGGDGMMEEAVEFWASHCRFCRIHVEHHDGADHDFEGESWSDWRLWWHSHAKFGAAPSGTDDETLRKLAKLMESYYVGLVINAAGERHAWAAVFSPPFSLVTQKLEFSSYRKEELEIKERVDGMMQHVQEKKYAPATPWTPPNHNGAAKSGGANSPNLIRLPRKGGSKSILSMSDEDFAAFVKGEAPQLVLPAGSEE